MPTRTADGQAVASALRDTLISPNVADSNFEPANVVDALDSIAAAIFRAAKALERLADARAASGTD